MWCSLLAAAIFLCFGAGCLCNPVQGSYYRSLYHRKQLRGDLISSQCLNLSSPCSTSFVHVRINCPACKDSVKMKMNYSLTSSLRSLLHGVAMLSQLGQSCTSSSVGRRQQASQSHSLDFLIFLNGDTKGNSDIRQQ